MQTLPGPDARPLGSWRRTYHDQAQGPPVTSSRALEALDVTAGVDSEAPTGNAVGLGERGTSVGSTEFSQSNDSLDVNEQAPAEAGLRRSRESGVHTHVSAPAPLAAERPSFVYALGQIETRYPSLSIEKEFAQAMGGTDQAGLTDRQTVKRAISERQNRYLARSLCWVFTIERLETYILLPRDPADMDLLMDAYREEPRRDDLDVIVGVQRAIASPEICNGLTLPIVVFDQLYSFDRDSLIESIPKPDSVAEKDLTKFRSTAGVLFDELAQIADNAGATDEHRALNYLIVRYPRLYAAVAEQFQRNFSFTGVEVLPSPLSDDVRSIVDVVFSFRHRESDVVEKQYVRVDASDEFPFLVTKMSPYYAR
jgi:hypothetical protein